MIYAYCRKYKHQINQLSAEQVQKWADNHSVHIDEFIWDDSVKQGDSYEKRNLGKYLFPKLETGDWLIVAEISCIGRSAIELQEIINTVFSVKKIRWICLSIQVDINFENISTLTSETLNMFFFAAKLQKTIIHETTKAALAYKRDSGIKLGSANKNWQKTIRAKSKEERDFSALRRGLSINKRTIEKPETQSFIKILRKTFDLEENVNQWKWKKITTKGHYKELIYNMMKGYQETEGLFSSWNLSDSNSKQLQVKLAAYIQSIRRSILFYYSHKMFENMDLNNYIIYVRKGKPLKSSDRVKNRLTELTNKKIIKNSQKNKFEKIFLDKTQIRKVEEDTQKSQEILSEIYIDQKDTDSEYSQLSKNVFELMRVLFSKETWSHEEVEMMCKSHKLMMGFALEQINEYSYSILEDVVIEDDGNTIYVMTEFKDQLI